MKAREARGAVDGANQRTDDPTERVALDERVPEEVQKESSRKILRSYDEDCFEMVLSGLLLVHASSRATRSVGSSVR